MRSTGCTCCIVLGDDFVRRGGEVNEEVIFEVPGAAREVRVIFLGKMRNFVNESEELWAKAPKGFNDAGDNTLPCGVGYLVVLSFSPRPAAKPTVKKAAVAYLEARGVRMDVSMRNSSPEGRCATTSMIASSEMRCSSGLGSLGS